MTDPDFITKAEAIPNCLGLFSIPADLAYLIGRDFGRNIGGHLISPLYYDHRYDVFMTNVSVLTFEEADRFVFVDKVRQRCITPRILEGNNVDIDSYGEHIVSRYVDRSYDHIFTYDRITVSIRNRSVMLQEVKRLPVGLAEVTAINPHRERGILQTFKGLLDAEVSK